MAQIDPETQEMLKSFVSEAFDSLDNNEPIVEDLQNENNEESVNAIFRVFHTLKGLSGFFEMYVINRVTHEAETLLDVMRKQNRPQSEEIISIIYQTFDFLRELLQRVNSEYTDKSAESEADDMILVLRDALDRIQNPEEAEVDLDELVEVAEEAAPETEPEPKKAAPAAESNDDSGEDLENMVSNEMFDQYLTSAYELIELSENNLLMLEKEPDNYDLVGETFGAIHSLKGNSGFMGLSEVEEIAIEVETILDSVRNKELEIDQTVVSVLLSNIETIHDRLSKLSSKSAPAEDNEEKIEISEPEPRPEPDEEPAAEAPLIEEEPEDEDDYEDEEEIEAEIKPELTPASRAPAKKPAAVKSKSQAKTPNFMQMQRKDIRIETSKIDKLFDLVGELITIETMVTNNPDLSGLELPNFNKSANMLNKITRELQEISMSIRMMPLEGLFNKMKRLVRDVSIKREKKVDFTISGQETEMDKNVIDEISDPLVHILRNAIDHGVETPEARLNKGKPETGHVSLKARYEGNEILIIVEDDGAGISRERVIEKAATKGLLTQPAEKMTDKEVFKLVFEPGFSTAEKVTDISGRGVGMDVVRKNIEKLKGAIDIDSKPGKGSVFTLRIPLTLAIMEAMIIRISSSKYALPIQAIKESFRADKEMITRTMDGLEVVKVREEVYPVIRLHELFDKEPDSTDLTNGILIIIEHRGKSVCLFADEIVGQQQAVIKGFSDYIGKVPGITGCMVLGDGGIGLIVDIESLILLSEQQGYEIEQ
ncbi:MAG: chemotaxis protein CheA [Candidatus Kapaibacterium sp.]